MSVTKIWGHKIACDHCPEFIINMADFLETAAISSAQEIGWHITPHTVECPDCAEERAQHREYGDDW